MTQAMILVIDDEEPVREAVVDILEYEGIDTLVAASGAEGVALYREHMDSIGLVLLDFSMPGMDGEETLQELKRINTAVPVLLSSGYIDEEINERFPKGAILGFLQKPYNLVGLVDAVRKYI